MPIKTFPLTEEHQALLEKRGISPDMAEKLGWLSCDGKKAGWIALPFLRKGKKVNTKYRRIFKVADEQNFEQDKGGEQCFYNLEALEALEKLPADELRTLQVVITEGELDCAVALQCGYLAVSVPSGAPGKPVEGEESTKYDFLKDFPKFAVALLAVDDDPAGHALRHDLAQRIGRHRCKWAQYPKDCKDLCDIFVRYGKKGIDVVLREKAKFLNVGGLFRMHELPAEPELPAYPCGIGNVSEMVKLRMGDFTVITGKPSGGKTSFVGALVCNMVKLYGWQICLASFEHRARGTQERMLRTAFIGRRPKDHFGNTQWTAQDIAAADRWISANFSLVVPDRQSEEMITLKWLLERVRAAITQFGAQLIVIDPWNELDHDRPHGMSLTEYTGFAIKELKRIAAQYLVHVIVVAHPAKPDKKLSPQEWNPTLYDISDSAHWYNKCDLGIVIHRKRNDEDTKWATLVDVQKVRDWGEIGYEGQKYLEYLPESGNYIDAPDFRAKGQKNTIRSESKKNLADKAKPSIPYKD